MMFEREADIALLLSCIAITGRLLRPLVPLLESTLNALVLGVVGLFKPPAVPGVLGVSSISHGWCRASWSVNLDRRSCRNDFDG